MMAKRGGAVVVLLCVLLPSSSAQTSLSSSVEFPVCPGQEVVLTCIGSGVSLSWMVTAQAGSTLTQNYLTTSTSAVNVTANHTIGDSLFEAVLTSTDPLTSTLTTTADTTLDGTVVECTSTTPETLTLQVTMTDPPSTPTGLGIMLAGQTAGITSATVTVQWGASSGTDSYTVSITPAIFEPVTVAGSMTSLVLEDVLFNTTYTVSVVASNCAGSSAAESVTFTIVPCIVPDSPVNSEWLQFSPSETVGPGTSLSLSCNPGYERSEMMASTCQPDGSWEPDTALLECVTVDCGPPTLASDVVVLDAPVSSTTFGSTFSFRCEEGLFPNTTFEAVCGADDQWSPDPANHVCRDLSEGGLSRGGIVGIVIVIIVLAVVCAVVVVVVVLVVRRRSGSSKEKNDRPQHEMHLYDDNKSPSHQDAEYNILHHNIPGQSNASNTAVQAVEYSTLGSNGQETPGLTYAEVGHQQQNKNKKSAAMATPKLNSNDDDRVMYSALAAGVTMPTTPEEPPLQPVDKQINLDALLIQLADVSSLWYQLGEVLGVARGTLDDINEACAVSKQFMVEMLDAWLRQQPYPTWKEVASALQVIGAGELGDSIMIVYTTGELPKQVNMTEVPAGSLPNSFHSGPPPPIPPKSTELNSILDSAPPRPPQRSGGGGGGGGGSKRAPPPIPSKGESIDYRAPPPIPRHDPAPPPQLPSRLDPPAPLLPARSDPEAPPRPPKVVPRGGGAGGGGGPPDAPQRPPKPVPRK